MIIRIAKRVLNNSCWHSFLDAIIAVIANSQGLHSFDISQYQEMKASSWVKEHSGGSTTIELIQGSTKLANRATQSNAVTLEVDDCSPQAGETIDDQRICVHPLGALQILTQPFQLIVEDETADGGFVLWMARLLGYDAIRNAYGAGHLMFRHAGGKGQFLKSARALTYGVWQHHKPIRALKLRTAALLDSDARFPGDDPNTQIAEEVSAHVAFVHILQRRSIENYAPEKYFRRRLGNGLKPAADAYFRLSEAQQSHFPVKKGFLDKDRQPLTLEQFALAPIESLKKFSCLKQLLAVTGYCCLRGSARASRLFLATRPTDVIPKKQFFCLIPRVGS